MENVDEVLSDESVMDNTATCASCRTAINTLTSKTPLCDSCRAFFVKFPFPKWIKLFGSGIALILIYSLISLPASIGTGIHYERGKIAAQNHNYATAQKEFEMVIKREPQFNKAKCQLLIAAFYNIDLKTMGTMAVELGGKNIDDDELLAKANSTMDDANAFLPSDSFNLILNKYHQSLDSIPGKELNFYMAAHPEDKYAKIAVAQMLFDQKKNREADDLLTNVLNKNPYNPVALMLKAPLKREMNQFDSSFYFADRLLSMNHENFFAYATKVRTLLKQKKDQEALALAKRTYKMDEKNNYSLASLALAYHFNNDIQNRDAILKKALQDSSARDVIQYALDIIDGKEKFRN